MSQHDMSIANQGFPSFRSDLNNALAALVSNSSGASAPSATFANQFWVDTSANPSVLKIRNADNDAWIALGTIDQTNDRYSLTPYDVSIANDLTTTGKVGIGASPSTKLDVSGPSGNTSFTGTNAMAITVRGSTSSTDYSAIDFRSSSANSGSTAIGRIGVVAGGAGSSMSFGTSNSYVNGITNTAMTIDPSGNVGIGTSSPAQALEVLRASNPTLNITETSGSSTTKLAFLGATTAERGALSVNFSTAEMRLAAGSSGNTYFQTFYTNGSERARIDSSGRMGLGTSSPDSNYYLTVGVTSSDTYAAARFNRGTTSSTTSIAFANPNGVVGTVSTSGTSTAYNTSSDYRLKENVQPMTGALAKVAQLKPVTYTWKADGSAGEGFIAHELQAVVPQCVTGEKDAVDKDGNPVYQGIDTSFLVATLTAAIQELKAEFDAYKASHP